MIYLRSNKSKLAKRLLKLILPAAFLLLFFIASQLNLSQYFATYGGRPFYENNALLEQIKELRYQNVKLREALGARNHPKGIPAKVSLKAGYLFADTMFINEGEGAGIQVGDWIVTEGGIFLGSVVKTGGSWSQVATAGGLGKKNVIRLGRQKNILVETIGKGLGESEGGFIAGDEQIKAGDAAWWGEDPQFIFGFVDSVNPEAEEIIIISPANMLTTENVLVFTKHDGE